jgi:tripartite-type tricarboxylate transporter receptor subunit TctC
MFHRICVAALLCAAMCATARAADYPARPVRLIIGYAAGGNTDIIGRVMATAMARKLGQTVVVENRPGAAAAIAREVVARSAPDGYMLLTDTSSFAGYPVFTRSPALDVQKAFTPISLLTEQGGTIVAPGNAPFSTFQEMIAYARAHPGKLNYSGIGVGVTLLTFESLKQQYGIDVVAVEYKGSGDAYSALLAGDVQLNSSSVGRVAADVASGRVKGLMVDGNRRYPQLPNTPSAAEVGFKGFYNSWQGLWGPAGMPGDIVNTLHAAVVEAGASKEVKDTLEHLEATALMTTPEGLAQRVDHDIREWREVVTKAHIPLQ